MAQQYNHVTASTFHASYSQSLNILPLTVVSPEPELLSASVHKPSKNKRQHVPVHFPPKNIKTKTHAELQFCLLFYTGVKLCHPQWEKDAGWERPRTGYWSRLHNEELHDLYLSSRSILGSNEEWGGRTCGTSGREMHGVWWETWGEKTTRKTQA